jgi:hypothetical protein
MKKLRSPEVLSLLEKPETEQRGRMGPATSMTAWQSELHTAPSEAATRMGTVAPQSTGSLGEEAAI